MTHHCTAWVAGASILLRKVYGRANVETGERATARHVYPLCSISKSFTALAVLSLVEAGRLSLDDPVEDHLPSWRGSPA